MIPRRHFLALAATPATVATLSDRVAARYVDHTALPHALQDVIATKDILTTNGSRSSADWVPSFDATVRERFFRAGRAFQRVTDWHTRMPSASIPP